MRAATGLYYASGRDILCYSINDWVYEPIVGRTDDWWRRKSLLALAFIPHEHRYGAAPCNDHTFVYGVLIVTELTIFFDGGCPLCAREIAHLERLDTRKKLAFENIYAPLFSENFPHIDQQAADLILHGQWRDGTIIYGLDVTYHSWALVGKGHWVAVLRWPIVKPLAQLGYRFFAKYRHRISALLTGKPRCESCEVSGPSK